MLLIDRTFVQQSSSYRPQVLKKGHTCGQVSARDTCARTVLFRVSFFANGLTNEECLVGNVESWKNLSLADTSGLVLGRLFSCWCCCVTGLQESYRYHPPGITLPLPVWARMSRASNNSCHTGRTNICPRSMSCQCCQLIGDRAAIQLSITSTEEMAHMKVSASNTCERTILFSVSIFAKGRINEACVLRNLESWQSLSLADTSDLVLGRSFVPNPPGASKNSVVTRNHVDSSSSEQEWEEDWTNLDMLEEQKVLPVLPIEWAFVQQSSRQ